MLAALGWPGLGLAMVAAMVGFVLVGVTLADRRFRPSRGPLSIVDEAPGRRRGGSRER